MTAPSATYCDACAARNIQNITLDIGTCTRALSEIAHLSKQRIAVVENKRPAGSLAKSDHRLVRLVDSEAGSVCGVVANLQKRSGSQVFVRPFDRKNRWCSIELPLYNWGLKVIQKLS